MPYKHLSAAERDTIGVLKAEGVGIRAIARSISRAHTTVSREIKRHTMFTTYYPNLAQDLADLARTKVAHNATKHRYSEEFKDVLASLCTLMETKRRSIQQGLRELRKLRPELNLPSHETVYRWMYDNKSELASRMRNAMVRRRQKRRSRRGKTEKKPTISNKRHISERPAEAMEKRVLGYIEGDLVIGKDSKSVVVTLADMTSRQTWILAVKNKSAASLRLALQAWVKQVSYPVKCITWDNGTEMADHEKFTKNTGVAVYFCDTHSPWQRPLNEQTNSVIRRWWPKGTDLPSDQAECDRVAHYLNTRVMPVLSNSTPLEVAARLGGAVRS